jgi:signal transduction histidine kinase
MIGFIALYQDWVPFLWNIIFTVLSHGLGSAFRSNLIFNHHAAIAHPWTWSLLHGVAVLAGCVGVVLFWKQTEDEQHKTLALREQLAATEIGRRRFTSDLLVNLARRNQNLLYRQLDLLNQLEESERDPDALADLFQLDHLATRIRRNAESLLVLSGEEPARKWGRPVPLADVVRAAIAETEDLDRVDFAVDESLAVSGRAVADLTHLVAEIIENAVHFSPPAMTVMVRTRTYLPAPGAHVLTVEDWGVGMTPDELAEANELLAAPRDVDLSVSQRLGLHVVARLAQRYGIRVSLTPTPGGGVTAVVLLPGALFDLRDEEPEFLSSRRVPAAMSQPAMPIEPAARTVTFAPPRTAIAPPPPAPPPLAARPLTPPYLHPMAEPFALPNAAQDDWHNWWTPPQRTNGHTAPDGWAAAPPTDYAGPPRSAPEPAPPWPEPVQPGPRPEPPASDRPSAGFPPAPDRPSAGFPPAPDRPSAGFPPAPDRPSAGFPPAGPPPAGFPPAGFPPAPDRSSSGLPPAGPPPAGPPPRSGPPLTNPPPRAGSTPPAPPPTRRWSPEPIGPTGGGDDGRAARERPAAAGPGQPAAPPSAAPGRPDEPDRAHRPGGEPDRAHRPGGEPDRAHRPGGEPDRPPRPTGEPDRPMRPGGGAPAGLPEPRVDRPLGSAAPDRPADARRSGASGASGADSTAAAALSVPQPTQPADPGGSRQPEPAANDAAGGATGAGADAAAGGPRLSRRVPLANLAEGLRRGQESPADEPQLIRDPQQAREALSRFQASQQAARAMLDGVDDPPDNAGGDRRQ